MKPNAKMLAANDARMRKARAAAQEGRNHVAASEISAWRASCARRPLKPSPRRGNVGVSGDSLRMPARRENCHAVRKARNRGEI